MDDNKDAEGEESVVGLGEDNISRNVVEEVVSWGVKKQASIHIINASSQAHLRVIYLFIKYSVIF